MGTSKRPEQTTQWADGTSAQVVEPTLTKKLAGWVQEKPPFQWFNWLFNTIDRWLQYLQALDLGDFLIQAESRGATVTSTGSITGAANAIDGYPDSPCLVDVNIAGSSIQVEWTSPQPNEGGSLQPVLDIHISNQAERNNLSQVEVFIDTGSGYTSESVWTPSGDVPEVIVLPEINTPFPYAVQGVRFEFSFPATVAAQIFVSGIRCYGEGQPTLFNAVFSRSETLSALGGYALKAGDTFTGLVNFTGGVQWTTTGWRQAIDLGSARAVRWPLAGRGGSSSRSIGIGVTADDILRFIASPADDNTGSFVYPFQFNMVTGALTGLLGTFWNSGNDGPGSGLNADLLDNFQAAAFGRLAANQTWTGVNFFNGNVYLDGPNATRDGFNISHLGYFDSSNLPSPNTNIGNAFERIDAELTVPAAYAGGEWIFIWFVQIDIDSNDTGLDFQVQDPNGNPLPGTLGNSLGGNTFLRHDLNVSGGAGLSGLCTVCIGWRDTSVTAGNYNLYARANGSTSNDVEGAFGLAMRVA